MALPTVLDHGIHTGGGTPVATNSVTPTVGRYWLLFVHSCVLTAAVAPSVPTVSGMGGTWTNAISNPYDSSGGAEARTDIFRCADASATGALSIAYPGQVPDDVTWCLVECIDVDPTAGPTKNGIVQTVTNIGATANPSVPMGALASPSNLVFGFLGSESDHGVNPITSGAGLTELAIDFQVASAAKDQAETEWARNVTTVNWQCAATNSWGATGIEVASAQPAAAQVRPLLPTLKRLGQLQSPTLGFPVPSVPATVATTPVSNSIDAPFEALGGVAQTDVDPLEAAGTAASTSTLPFEAAQGIVQVGNPDPVEAAQGVATTAADPLESAGAVAAPGQLPYEEVQALAGQQAVLPTEAAQGITATGPADPIEAGQGISQTGVDPLESAGGVASTAGDPYESAGPASTTASAPYEAAQGVAATGGTDPLEAAGGVAQTGGEPLEALGGVATTGEDPYESLQAGVTPVSQALALAFEALGAAASAPTLPLEALMGVVVQGAADALEALGGILASAVDAVESALGLSTSASDPIESGRGISQTAGEPTDAAGGVASSPTVPFESIQQLAGATAVLPYESFLGAGTATASLPYDVLGALLAGDALPVEALGFVPVPAPDAGAGRPVGPMGGPERSSPLPRGRRVDDDEELVRVLDLLDLL